MLLLVREGPCAGGSFGFAIKIKSQGFVNASDMRFSAYSDRDLVKGIEMSRLWRGRGYHKMGLRNTSVRDLWDSEIQFLH